MRSTIFLPRRHKAAKAAVGDITCKSFKSSLSRMLSFGLTVQLGAGTAALAAGPDVSQLRVEALLF